VKYPLVADINKTISEDYDVLAGNYSTDENGKLVVEGELVAYRGLFLIDKAGIVRHQIVNDMPLGRSIRECLRIVDALQHFEQHGEVCPMDWQKGDEAMTADHEGVSSYLSK
jgi:peroxiredoxin (alkyl hydroperoxide reductase subunit C)